MSWACGPHPKTGQTDLSSPGILVGSRGAEWLRVPSVAPMDVASVSPGLAFGARQKQKRLSEAVYSRSDLHWSLCQAQRDLSAVRSASKHLHEMLPLTLLVRSTKVEAATCV